MSNGESTEKFAHRLFVREVERGERRVGFIAPAPRGEVPAAAAASGIGDGGGGGAGVGVGGDGARQIQRAVVASAAAAGGAAANGFGGGWKGAGGVGAHGARDGAFTLGARAARELHLLEGHGLVAGRAAMGLGGGPVAPGGQHAYRLLLGGLGRLGAGLGWSLGEGEGAEGLGSAGGGSRSRARARAFQTGSEGGVCEGSMARVEGIGPRAGSTRTSGLLFEPIAIVRAVTGAPAVARRPERDGGGRAASCESRAAGAE